MSNQPSIRVLWIAVLATGALLTMASSAQVATPGGPSSPAVLGGDNIPDLIVSPESGIVPTRALSGADGTLLGEGFPFGPGFAGGTRIAVGDLTGDGVADIVAGMGPGGGQVLLLDGNTAAPLGAGAPFGGFGGGVFVAVGDVNADGRNDIVVGQGVGGGGLSVFSGIDYSPLLTAAPFGGGFTGGVTVAAGDVNGDGHADLVVGQAVGGLVSIIDGATHAPIVTGPPYGGGFGGGVYVAAGDVNGNGRSEIVLAPGSGPGPVLVYDVVTLAPLANFYPYGPGFTAGVRVAVADFTGDGQGEIVTSPGPGGGSTVAVFLGGTFAPFVALPVYSGFSGGVYVAAAADAGLRFTSPAAATFTVGQAASFTIQTAGLPVATSITQSGALPGGVAFTNNGNGTATLSGTPSGPGGTFPLTFTASNGSAMATQNFVLTIGQAPVITSAAAANFSVGAAGSFTVTTTGFPAPTLSSTGALPTGVTFTPGPNGTAVIAGTPAAGTGGSYPLSITASNGVGAPAVQSFVLTVAGTPVFTSPNATTFTVGVAGNFSITTASSPVATSITRSGALPTGVNFTNNGDGTATLAGTPAAGTAGSYPLTFTASNGVGAPIMQSFVLSVHQTPAITSASSTTFNETIADTFTITTTGFPTPQIQATGALPNGVNFADNGNGTATLAGTPAAGSSGAYPITITASNGVGSPAMQSFTLTIGTCTTVVSPPSGPLPAGTLGAAYSQMITASGGAGFTFTVSAGSTPPGVNLASGGLLSGTPTASGTFNFTVDATPLAGCVGHANYSITVSPVAANESFSNGVGNTQYSVGAGAPGTPAVMVAGSVLTNDQGSGVLTAGPAGIATTNGGQVAMATDGTFLYTPPLGFAGPSDTFTYTLTDGNGLTDTAQVTINLSGVVWYVNAAAVPGDGRSHAPFATMTAAAAAAQAGQAIYVHSGAPAGGTVLQANQTLWGAGAMFTLNGLMIPAATAPSIETVTLANGVVVNSVSINGGGAAAIIGNGLTGTETLNAVTITGGTSGLNLTGLTGTLNMTGGSISGVTGGGSVVISGGTGTVAVGAAITSTSGRSIDVQNRTAGTVTFSGAITDTSGGIFLNANTGSTIAFTGGMAVSTAAVDAFSATGGGTITATQNNTSIVNSLSSLSGAALRVVNTNIGAAGLTFRSLSAGSSSDSTGVGVVLDNTGTAAGNGGLTVTGDGFFQSGGIIQRKLGTDGLLTEGIGVYLNSTKNVSLSWMEIKRIDNSAIVGRNVTGFQLINASINGIGTTAGIAEGPIVFGTAAAAGNINGLLGSGLIRDSVIMGGIEHTALFYNHSGTMSLQVDRTTAIPGDCFIGSNDLTTGGLGLGVIADGTASVSTTVDKCRIRNNRTIGLLATASSNSNLTLVVTGSPADPSLKSEFSHGSGGQGIEGIVVQNADNATATVTIENTTMAGFDTSAIRVGQAPGNASSTSMLRATIRDNVIDSPAAATGAAVFARLSSTIGQVAPARLLFGNNVTPTGAGVVQYGQPPGILVSTPDASTTPNVDVTITGNHIDMRESGSGTMDWGPIGLDVQATLGSVCANVQTNISHRMPSDTVPQGGGIRLLQSGTGTMSLERGAEPLASPASTVLATNNPAPLGTTMITDVQGTVTVVENATCLLPSAP